MGKASEEATWARGVLLVWLEVGGEGVGGEGVRGEVLGGEGCFCSSHLSVRQKSCGGKSLSRLRNLSLNARAIPDESEVYS